MIGRVKQGKSPRRIPIHAQKAAIRNLFREINGYEPNLENPRTFNEKMQWLKLYYRDKRLTTGADKYAVRNYVKEQVGKRYLSRLLGVYDQASDINFQKLPQKFVLKTTTGSGTNIICDDKAKLDTSKARQLLDQWLQPHNNHYYFSYEWCYKDIPPRIIGEEYMSDIASQGLKDYKFMCFNGKPELLFVCTGRDKRLAVDFFTMKWQKLSIKRQGIANHIKTPSAPANLLEMIDIARQLAKPFPFVRVDLYDTKKGPIFGELTFYPWAGLEPFNSRWWDNRLGDMLILPRRSLFYHFK
jgi:hypothetical protein